MISLQKTIYPQKNQGGEDKHILGTHGIFWEWRKSTSEWDEDDG